MWNRRVSAYEPTDETAVLRFAHLYCSEPFLIASEIAKSFARLDGSSRRVARAKSNLFASPASAPVLPQGFSLIARR
jgi:hypothetical protein